MKYSVKRNLFYLHINPHVSYLFAVIQNGFHINNSSTKKEIVKKLSIEKLL